MASYEEDARELLADRYRQALSERASARGGAMSARGGADFTPQQVRNLRALFRGLQRENAREYGAAYTALRQVGNAHIEKARAVRRGRKKVNGVTQRNRWMDEVAQARIHLASQGLPASAADAARFASEARADLGLGIPVARARRRPRRGGTILDNFYDM